VKAVRRMVVLSALAFLLLAPPVVSQVSDDKLIVPGVRVGKWTLKMTINELIRMNGQPSLSLPVPTIDLAKFYRAHCWFLEGAEFCATYLAGPNVAWLRIRGGQFRTEKGLTSDSPRVVVERAYGKPTAETQHDRAHRKMIYNKIGLAFVVSMGKGPGGEEAVLVFRPGQARMFWKF